jgi:ubiquinone biosynthesis protein UbiJ
MIAEPLQHAALAGIEEVLNRLLRLDAESSARLAALGGKVVEIRVAAPELRLYVSAADAGLRIEAQAPRAPDAVISGPLFTLLRSGLGRESAERPAAGQIDISGDTDAAKALQALLWDLDIDWEEQLSRAVGDVVAHQVGNAARDLKQWLSQSRETIEHSLSEYLREEAELLSSHHAVETFGAAVDALRADADRLAQRIERLERRVQTDSHN